MRIHYSCCFPATFPPFSVLSLTSSGQLLSTPSRLLKLVLPLHPPKLDSTDSKQPSESPPAASTAPLAILAHPGQPLSYLERLISSELPPIASPSRPRSIHFLAPNTPTDATTFPAPSEPTLVRYSPATELGDFLRDASKSSFFLLHIEGSPSPIRCSVPSFLSRTYYLRLRLRSLSRSLATQTALKAACDAEAHKGAKRAALSGLGGLISWWAGVAYATFYTPLGWEVMEPVTYLVGLSGVISGYLWFLWHDREVSYRNWQHLAVTRRQARLYEEKGFDMERWQELVQEARRVRREVREVAGEFGVEWDGREEGIGEGEDGEVVKEVLDREDDSARGKGVIEDREREIKEDMERDKKELKDEREKAKREKEQQAKG